MTKKLKNVEILKINKCSLKLFPTSDDFESRLIRFSVVGLLLKSAISFFIACIVLELERAFCLPSGFWVKSIMFSKCTDERLKAARELKLCQMRDNDRASLFEGRLIP